MKIIETVNENGCKKRYAINDDDNPEEAEHIGINIGVPDLSGMNMEVALVELNNVLYDMGLFTIDDIASKEGALIAAVLSVFKSKVVKLYKGVGQ